MAKQTRTLTVTSTVTAVVDDTNADHEYLWGELVDRVTAAADAVAGEPRYAFELGAAAQPPAAEVTAVDVPDDEPDVGA